jgi:hypothetical protein
MPSICVLRKQKIVSTVAAVRNAAAVLPSNPSALFHP